MTVLEEVESGAPPHKRLCLSYSRSKTYQTHMATPIDGVMLNGYGLVDSHKNHSPDDSSANSEVSPVATLCNLGNTCFLNSVLYTLRFAPAFLHNLHHLARDLEEFSGRYSHLKSKSSSLGRGISGGKNWGPGSKDVLSMGHKSDQEEKIAMATLRLHDLYESLHSAELKDHLEPYQPEIFLTALRDVNPIFEGNQQHDAHELLVCLLDNIRETCRQLSQLSERQRCIIPPAPPCLPPPPKTSFSSSMRKSLKLVAKPKSNGTLDKKPALDGPLINGDANMMLSDDDGPRIGHNFISEDFQGVTLLRTTCMECEQVTERKETFCDICVPITSPSGNCDDVSALYHSAIVTEEFLQDTNKYWCESCLRLNEARRCVRYESLPRLLILQLKRFSSSSYGSVVSKVNEYMPTPLSLGCFCLKCKDGEETKKVHRGYQLYGVIMHLGASMASGHYVTYVCSRDTLLDCASCTRDKRRTASLSGGAGKPAPVPEKHSNSLLRFFKSAPKPNSLPLDGRSYLSACRSADCCGVKLETAEPTWLECDDETVRSLTQRQLEEILAPKSVKTALTPYLLFYCRLP